MTLNANKINYPNKIQFSLEMIFNVPKINCPQRSHLKFKTTNSLINGKIYSMPTGNK
jgi:hypothetical protein